MGAGEIASDFVGALAELHFPHVFNPYSDVDLHEDRAEAASIRRRNLERVLSAAIGNGVSSVWIARDLGYRGGRRTGLAMTDEPHLAAHGRLFGIDGLGRSTRGPQIAERTATTIWNTLSDIDRPVFLWNVFPLHPHLPGDRRTNRLHTRIERTATRPFLLRLLDVLRPTQLVAIGRDAQAALADLGIGMDVQQVRHPSYGGQTEFESTARALYGVQRRPEPDLFS